jgi:hypothetical protein
MTTEIFKEFPIEQYKDRYTVSNKGNIWSNRKNKYINTIVSDGYSIITVNLPKSPKREQLRVDIIVALAFITNKSQYLQHIDGDPLNNESSNLQWVTYKDFLKNTIGGAWETISNNDKYLVSDKGQVWSTNSRNVVKQQVVSGYYSVVIGYPKSCFTHVHRLVAKTFLENQNNHPVVNHKDMDKFNNNVGNLEWVTYSENSRHAIVNGNRASPIINSNRTEPIGGVSLDAFQMYLITRCGKVYSQKVGRYLTLQKNDNGYFRARLTVNGKPQNIYIHRLVAQAYLDPPCIGQTQVNHKNMNRADNCVENLEWMTPSENVRHSADSNPQQYSHLQKKVARLDTVTEEVLEIYEGVKVASRSTKINSGSIVKVCKNIKPTAGGFKWKYIC